MMENYSLFGNTFHWILVVYRNQQVHLQFIFARMYYQTDFCEIDSTRWTILPNTLFKEL